MRSIKIADLNDDGRNDIVISYDTRIGILYQNASGSFDPIESSASTGALVVLLDTGDLNQDGLQDIVISTEYAAFF